MSTPYAKPFEKISELFPRLQYHRRGLFCSADKTVGQFRRNENRGIPRLKMTTVFYEIVRHNFCPSKNSNAKGGFLYE
jgi:hypothetical protein